MHWDSFPALLAHELRNPLAGISAHVEVLKELMDPFDPRLESVKAIEEEVRRIDRVIMAILEFTRTGKTRRRKVDTGAFLNEWWKNTRKKYENTEINFVLDVPSRLGKARLDKKLMERVLDNIVDNAVNAMGGDKGTIRIIAGERSGGIHISIIDTGPGIPKERLERIFEPFYSTSPKGFGLGLALAKKIVDAHGGSIYVSSKKGDGANFTISIPMEKESRENDACTPC